MMLLEMPKTRRWTKNEYHQAIDLGWFDGQRVELIDGKVVEIPPQRDDHAHGVTLADYLLRESFGRGFVVRVQLPMNPPGESEPEPDLVIVRGTPRTVTRHPSAALLVVEVADTTLAFDRSVKARLYARAGIRDYWIINLVDRQLEVRRRSVPDGRDPFGHDYAEVTIFQPGETISPLALRKAKIKVDDLLP